MYVLIIIKYLISVAVYETLATYRTKENLVSRAEAVLIRKLANIKTGEALQLKAVDVVLQSETGKNLAIAIRLIFKHNQSVLFEHCGRFN